MDSAESLYRLEIADLKLRLEATGIQLDQARDELKRANLQIDRLKRRDAEASEHVEAVICGRTGFTGDPPYVGWEGLGLALREALDERDRLRTDTLVKVLREVQERAERMRGKADGGRPLKSAAEACAWIANHISGALDGLVPPPAVTDCGGNCGFGHDFCKRVHSGCMVREMGRQAKLRSLLSNAPARAGRQEFTPGEYYWHPEHGRLKFTGRVTKAERPLSPVLAFSGNFMQYEFPCGDKETMLMWSEKDLARLGEVLAPKADDAA